MIPWERGGKWRLIHRSSRMLSSDTSIVQHTQSGLSIQLSFSLKSRGAQVFVNSRSELSGS